MKVAAWQAPLLPAGRMDALGLLRARVRECEAQGVAILCCPEAVLGGLADHAAEPARFALPASQLPAVLAPLASDTVTTIVGFTELGDGGALYNSAAVLHRGSVIGIYRKLHPAIRRSVYHAGSETPVFSVGGVTFGIVICYDSTFAPPARRMADRGAAILFIPTSNGLPPHRASAGLVAEARACDVARATENGVWIVRADVAGRTDALVSHGSSAIVDPHGRVVRAARELEEELLIVDIDPSRATREARAAAEVA